MHGDVALAGSVALAAVFAVSGAAKLVDAAATREAVAAFGVVPARRVGLVAALLAPVELVTAALILGPPTRLAGLVWGLGLLAAFTRTVGLAVRAGRRIECRCFGRIGGADISGRTVARNGVLMLIAVVALATRPPSGTSPAHPALAAAAGVLLAALVVAAEGLAGRAARRARDRADVREFEQAEGAHARKAPPITETGVDLSLPGLDGKSVALHDLLAASEQPTLLVFLSPGCGPCRTLRPAVTRWAGAFADRVQVVAVTHGDLDRNRRDYAAAGGDTPALPVLLDDDLVLRDTFKAGSPGGVLLAPDGTALAPVGRGEQLLRRLLAQALDADPLPTDADAKVEPPPITGHSVLSPGPAVTATPRADDGGAEQLVLVDEATGRGLSLDPLGAVVWSVLDGTSPLAAIVTDLAAAFGAPYDVVERDTFALAEALAAEGLIAVTEPAHAPAPTLET